MNVSQQRAALENETAQIYEAAKRLAARAEKLAAKARRWEFVDTAEDVGGFGATVETARRDYLWHRLPDGVAEQEARR